MPGMPRTPALIALLIALVAGVAGCDKKSADPPATLPDGPGLVSASADAMRQVKNAHMTITVDGTLANLPLKKADGVVTQTGDAQGNVQLEQLGSLVELGFVILNKTFYLKGPTGAWQQVPLAMAATFYDPSAILDPGRGVANVLATAKDAKTEGQESVDGRDTYRVAASFDQTALGTVVPGAGAGVTGKLWIDTQDKRLRKAVFTVPGAAGAAPATVTVTATDFDAAVTISAPV
jgi:lipoprotein LprG